jgi:hypothetical protein
MAKGLRNAALLGGAALLASKMMGGSKGSKDSKKRKDEQEADAAMDVMSRPDMSTTGDASAGMAKTNMDDFARKIQQDVDAQIPVNPRTAPARRTTSVQDADAKKAAKYAEQYNRDRAESLYAQKMRRLEKEQALGRVAPEEYIGPGGALKMLSNVARGMAGRNSLRTITQPALTNETRKLTNEPLRLTNMKKGGTVKSSKGATSASKRADGIATRGKTRGRVV